MPEGHALRQGGDPTLLMQDAIRVKRIEGKREGHVMGGILQTVRRAANSPDGPTRPGMIDKPVRLRAARYPRARNSL